jgi:cephalosporin hydroxylase
MKLVIDSDARTLTIHASSEIRTVDLFTKEAFQLISQQWLTIGWNQKYSYTFSWMGRPMIQLPEDMLRLQEVIYSLKPDWIIETGVAHGGSLIFHASLCRAMNKGRVIGVDIEIKPHNRQAITEHELAEYITLIEGNSVEQSVIDSVKSHTKAGERILIILDSNHSREHVLAELYAYADIVSPGSYLVVTDGIMRDLSFAPRGDSDWDWNNPCSATREFLENRSDFSLNPPKWIFNESLELDEVITYWPDAWLLKC